jgi:hypothetical protein
MNRSVIGSLRRPDSMVQEKTPQRTGFRFKVPEVSGQLVRIGLVKVAGQDLDIQYGLIDGLGHWGLVHVFLLSSE